MALRNFEFYVGINGIVPNMITDAGVQGEHGVTSLKFELSNEIYEGLNEGKVLYRFDIYDGEGGIWQSSPLELSDTNVSLTLEERHTRFGGKLLVYLVITALSEDGVTDVELYNSPVVLCFNNRPDGVYQQGENYESVVSIAEGVKKHATQAKEFATEVEKKLKNGEFDGVGVQKTEIIDDELIISYTNGISKNLGNIKGDKGDKGEKGDKGDKGEDAVIDQTYSPTSVNAQSGIAVAKVIEKYYTKDECNEEFAELDGRIQNVTDFSEGVSYRLVDDYYTKEEIDNLDAVKYIKDINGFATQIMSPNETQGIQILNSIIKLTSLGRITNIDAPSNDLDAVNKKYVDSLIGDIESLLGGI